MPHNESESTFHALVPRSAKLPLCRTPAGLPVSEAMGKRVDMGNWTGVIEQRLVTCEACRITWALWHDDDVCKEVLQALTQPEEAAVLAPQAQDPAVKGDRLKAWETLSSRYRLLLQWMRVHPVLG